MFELRVEMEFPAGHHLRGYAGDCARPHGHNWKVEALVRSAQLDSVGMAIDFRILKSVLQKIIAPWDHQDLNELPEFSKLNPTAEWIAKLIYEKCSQELLALGSHAKVDRITVWENSRCSATYFHASEEMRAQIGAKVTGA